MIYREENSLDSLNNKIYLTQEESRINIKTIPVIENKRLGINTVDFSYIDRIHDYSNKDYLSIISSIEEENNIDNLYIVMNEESILKTPDISNYFDNIVLRPLSENDIVSIYTGLICEEYINTMDSSIFDFLLDESKLSYGLNRIRDKLTTHDTDDNRTKIIKGIGRGLGTVAAGALGDCLGSKIGNSIDNKNRQNAEDKRNQLKIDFMNKVNPIRTEYTSTRDAALLKNKLYKKNFENREKYTKQLSDLMGSTDGKTKETDSYKKKFNQLRSLSFKAGQNMNKYNGFTLDFRKADKLQRSIKNLHDEYNKNLSKINSKVGNKNRFSKVGLAMGATLGSIPSISNLYNEYKNKPKNVLAKIILKLRRVYGNWMRKASAAREAKVGTMFTNAASRLLEVIDKLLKKLQISANSLNRYTEGDNTK